MTQPIIQPIIIPIETKLNRFKNQFEQFRDTLLNDVLVKKKKKKSLIVNDVKVLFTKIEGLFDTTLKCIKDQHREKLDLIQSNNIKNNNNNNNNNNNSNRSYVEVTRNPHTKTNKPIATKHVITIHPKSTETDMTSEELKKQIKTNLSPEDLGYVSINRMKCIRNNSLLIECDSKNDCEQLQNTINSKISDICEAKIPKKSNPRIIVYNIYNEREQTLDQMKQELQNSIINRNRDISSYLENKNIENEMIFKYFIRSKQQNLNHLVIEVTPELRKVFLNLQKINLLFTRNGVKDFVSITRCFNCLGFGHTKANCSSEQKSCSKCAHSGHSHNECTVSSVHHKYVNCFKYNSSLKNPNAKKYDTNHDAFHSFCPSLQYMKNLITSKIDYGL